MITYDSSNEEAYINDGEQYPRDRIEYVEICKTVKKKAREDIRKHNLNEIRETIEASKSLKRFRKMHSRGKNRMITLLDKQGK